MKIDSPHATLRPRPWSASDLGASYQLSSPLLGPLHSYSFPPAPRTADDIRRLDDTDDPSAAVSPFDCQFSFEPPMLSHFLSPEDNDGANYGGEDLPMTHEDEREAALPEAPGPHQFSTLGRAVYEGQDARQVLSSFSFAKLLQPPPHEDHLPSPPPTHRPRQFLPSFQRAFPSPDTSRAASPLPSISEALRLQSRVRQDTPEQPTYAFPPHSPNDNERNPLLRSSPFARSPNTLHASEQHAGDQRSAASTSSTPNAHSVGFIPPKSHKAGSTARRFIVPSADDLDSSQEGANWRGDSRVASRKARPKINRSVAGLFRPSVQSMLAPELRAELPTKMPPSAGQGSRTGRPWNPPLKALELDSLITKRSRGRKPPRLSPLTADPSGSCAQENPSLGSQKDYAGGKQDKKKSGERSHYCQVQGCGKVFKRSEHLQRHIRSIHTNSKPFQCQWPACGRFFSRHDNLNQHLRVHREPNLTDKEFSAQIAACFNRKLVPQAIARRSTNSTEPPPSPPLLPPPPPAHRGLLRSSLRSSQTEHRTHVVPSAPPPHMTGVLDEPYSPPPAHRNPGPASASASDSRSDSPDPHVAPGSVLALEDDNIRKRIANAPTTLEQFQTASDRARRSDSC
ncbi:uncharacterized protein JCM15063_002744 [Sporobolomyces koalae]|uniref:uncharacterized protein n=1 Tax=Sporobolomyces koalae TaxID=500713 RepID=UPI0031824A25